MVASDADIDNLLPFSGSTGSTGSRVESFLGQLGDGKEMQHGENNGKYGKSWEKGVKVNFP